MEFDVRNNYIKKFLSNYSNQNQLKLIKYLTVIGIHHLHNTQQNKASYYDLKKIASKNSPSHLDSTKLEDIVKSVPKEDKKLNKELKIIKNELAKLNEKFEDKLK